MTGIRDADRPLLRALQDNGRISNQDLSDAAAMSTSACWRRMKALEEEGVIEGYTAVLNAAACGLAFHAIVHITLSRHRAEFVEEFLDAIVERSEVMDCFATTGDADYFLRISCADLDAYNDFLENFLFKLSGVANIKTHLVLRQIKQSTRLPV